MASRAIATSAMRSSWAMLISSSTPNKTALGRIISVTSIPGCVGSLLACILN